MNISTKKKTVEYLLWIIVAIAAASLYFIPFRSTFSNIPESIAIMMLSMIIPALIYMIFLAASSLFCQKSYKEENFSGCTVIIPAYNEGIHVAKTIATILQSDVPPEHFELIAVNDGSVDDTLYWMKEIQKECKGQLKIINFPQNRGKKHALAAGFRASKFDFCVTVDSDTEIYPDTLRKLLAPFADQKIGAVAGNIRAKSGEYNFFTVMMDVLLVFGCEFLRASQSANKSVFCTPGALSAYRKSVILPLLDRWLNQTFCGKPANIGEDRAIATMILEQNYHIVHAPEAVADTFLPKNYSGVCKMLLRWNRSDFRENLTMAKFIFRQNPLSSTRNTVTALHWLMLSFNMFSSAVSLPLLIFLLIYSPDIITAITITATGTFFWSAVPAIVYAKTRSFREGIWGFVFGLFSLAGLSYLMFYAMLTVTDSRWLTREKSVKTKAV